MSRIDPDIAEWQREGPLFGCYDDPSTPGDRLCVETHNVYHHDCMVQVGPYFVHKDIFAGHFYPPKPEDYEPEGTPTLSLGRTAAIAFGLALLGVGIALIIPV